MKVSGTILNAEFNIDTFDMIKEVCQTLGIVDENGRLVAELKNNKIIRCDTSDGMNTRIMYDKPFDVKYAAHWIKIYEYSKNYITLSGVINNRNKDNVDYQTASKLELTKKNISTKNGLNSLIY